MSVSSILNYHGQYVKLYLFIKLSFAALHPETECSLFEVQNGEVSISYTGPGGTANVSCNQCYSLDGQSSLKCTEMMEWDQPIPSCKRNLAVL